MQLEFFLNTNFLINFRKQTVNVCAESLWGLYFVGKNFDSLLFTVHLVEHP